MRAVVTTTTEPTSTEALGVTESTQYVIGIARRLVEKLRVVDFRSYEPLSAEAAVGFMTRGAAQQVYQSMTEAIRLIGSLPVLILNEPDSHLEVDTGTPVDGDGVWLESDEVSVEGVPDPPHDRVVEEIDEALARLTEPQKAEGAVDPELAVSIWKMLATQLKQGRARLATARRTRSKWALITEGEEGRRKALKSLQYGITLAMHVAGFPGPGVAFPEDPAELQVALQVRETLLSLRRDLLVITSPVSSLRDYELNIVLRDVRIRILDLFLSRTYQDVRAADRFAIQGLRQRVDSWLNSLWDDGEAARRLLSDIRAFATLLGEVNNRELLVTYDRVLKAQCLESLDDLTATLSVSRRDGWWRYLRALREVDALRYRSDTFDRFLEGELKATARTGDHLTDSIDAARRIVTDIKT
jgi:hypothetical protein